MLVEISALIAALAFAVLVVFLIQTLRSAKHSLDKASRTMEDVQQTVQMLSGDLQAIARNANHMTEELQGQLKKIEPVADSVQNAGEALNELTLAAKQVSVGFVSGVRKAASRFEKKRQDGPAPGSQPANAGGSYAGSPAPGGQAASPVQDGVPGASSASALPLAAAAAEHPQPGAAAKQGGDDWKAWVDLGIRAWQLWRQRS
ncbi:DUF948 domain-containing protein [Paenibacillus thiaminolyticus]|uniref:DUF948 domain-containing protein n=1 Tax=Paenibacillus thiaminolyticus TaxID=49283 RepID=A0AAP9DX85_PANTH|nr:DUF948 domain-containing protein [Paenibacillus thiaminolyticus]MCY9536646.1 DUF948 domain-containing protein [Paenibacillus thiaminolyticus]MCY9603811.1 DUF948 domain-containing protein [Paenibacillus thiaminolyticus]MCY9609915.1 DUF948 domain-containing protein [Paenibacillus thiaminolyticus]MCY9613859.1 DUF948 domain-containing protein [Paenibacillus thiaminolyticus]MCY9620761.1 DUF948 domain-containing protein [Paenibacillus thiaminolyticus]